MPLNHSIQNIFIQVGQYDRYAIFDFYYGSDAFKKYGTTVYGHIIYTPSQRAHLKKEMESNNIGDDDGLILLDGALQDKNKNEELRTVGFMAKDVYRLSTLDIGPIKNEYENKDIKDIPNTIKIDFDASGTNAEEMQLMMFRKRLEKNIPFIPYELQKYYSLIMLLEPENLSEEDKVKYLMDVNGHFHHNVIITVLSTFVHFHKQEQPYRGILNKALYNRRIERINYICKHLGIAAKHIDNLKESNPNSWNELVRVVYGFEPETLTLWGWKHHIYWDFERFIHIYLRHYPNFFIPESSKGQGTSFQYNFKDIRRIVTIVLKANKEAIEDRLSAGKGFHIQNEKGYYYNGNYYSLKIESDGRLAQFHPQDQVNTNDF